MEERDTTEADEPMPARLKVIAAIVVLALVIASAAMMLRMGSPAIVPDQAPPAGHYGLSCALCHPISADAAKVDAK